MFYATIDSDSVREYMPDVPVLLPASSWARHNMRPPKLPDHVTERAADCGGYVATFRWGDYRYTPEQYADWLDTFAPSWAATMDYCCEPEVAGGGLVRARQDRTTDMAYHFWSEYRDASWCWAPTVQGWEPEDYRRHARELRPLVEEMQAHYGPGSAFRVGIGTLCRRASPAMIRAVTTTVATELPGVPLHLWGIKLQALQSRLGLPEQVASIDSAAWNGQTGTNDRARNDGWRGRMSRRRWCYQVALPAYLAKVQAALDEPKQLPLC